MKVTSRTGVFVIAVAILAIGAAMFSMRVGAQEEGWQIVRADYGFKNQRNDVTDIAKDLIGRGGVNGRVAVNNQTMGGDPAPGADKHLHIFARNRRGEEREFDYKEGGFVEVRTFNVRRDDWDDRPANYGGRDQDDHNGIRIVRAYYGLQGKTVNATRHPRRRGHAGGRDFLGVNKALGEGPAPWYDQ